MSFDPVPGILATTSTAGTGPFTSTGAVSGFRAGSVLANGTEVPVTRWDASWAFEEGTCTVSTSGGTTTWTWVRRTRTSNGVNSPVNWAPGGTQNVVVGLVGSMVLYWHNYLAELAGNLPLARANLGLGTAAVLDVGTTASKVVQLTAAAKLPAVDGSLLTNLPPGTPSVPSGTRMLIYANAAPSGWTLYNIGDDMVVGITNNSGLGGGGPHAGGTTGGISWDPTFGMTISTTALSAAQIPLALNTMAAGSGSGGGGVSSQTASAHGHTPSHTSGWRPPTAYFRLCEKT